MARILIRKAMPSWFEDSLLITKALIMKSAIHWDKETGMPMPGWSPEEVLNPDEGNKWYDQWDDRGTGLRAHHPAHAFNPKTGELRFNPDGTPAGHHPIDAVIKKLDEDLHAMFEGQHPYTSGKKLMEMAIDRYNEHHDEDSNHRLPNVDSVEWRRLYANTEYQKGVHPRDRLTRGDHTVFPEGSRPLGTYHTNTGTSSALGANRGLFLDSGAIPMHGELGYILHHANNWYSERGIPEVFGNVDKRHYIRNNHVNVNLMTNDDVRSMNTSQANHFAQTGQLPHGFYSEEQPAPELPHGTAYSHSTLGRLPEAFFGHGNLGGATKDAGVEKRRRFEEFLAQAGEHHGFELSDEEKEDFLGTQAAAITFGRPGEAGSASYNMVGKIGEELGLDPEVVAEHRKGIRGGGREAGGGRARHEFAAHVGAHIAAAGPENFKNATYRHPRLKYDQKYLDVGNKVADAMNKVYGHELHEYGELPEGGMPVNLPSGLAQTHEVPEHMHPHLLTPHNLALQGSQQPLGQPAPIATPETLAPRQASALHRQPTPEELAQRERLSQYRSPAEMQMAAASQGMRLEKPEYAFAGSRPGQQTFDPVTSETVSRLMSKQLGSKMDVSNAIDRIQKAMENMQLEKVMEDSEIMKHVPVHSINSSMEMGMFAKSLGLTGYDVRAINATQGDWDKIANKWHVSKKIVGIVKATCRGVAV